MIENFDRVSYIFRDYLFNFVQFMKKKYEEDLLSIILFGSVARGKWNQESDIDLLMLFSNRTSLKQLSKIIFDFESKTKLKDSTGNQHFSTIQDFRINIIVTINLSHRAYLSSLKVS